MRRSLLLAAIVPVALVLGACASTNTAGSSATAQTAAANTVDAATAPFVGSKKSKKYYPASCQTVQLIKVDERVGFGSMKDAEAAGYAKDLYSTDCRY